MEVRPDHNGVSTPVIIAAACFLAIFLGNDCNLQVTKKDNTF